MGTQTQPALTVSYHQSSQRTPIHAYGLRVVVEEATGMDKEVFVYRKGATPANDSGELPTDAFVCIADPVDLEDYPIGEPDLENEMPYYREAEVTIYFRCVEDLDTTRQDIKNDLALLVRSMTRLQDTENYEKTETETVRWAYGE